MKTKIYVLCEPDGEIRYVGKTVTSLDKRLYHHLHYARTKPGAYKEHWVRSLLQEGYLPTIRLIGEVEGNGSAEEIAWIKYGRDEGWRLTNLTDGGEGSLGAKRSAATVLKMKKALTGRRRTLATCRLMSKSAKGKVISQITRDRISSGMKNNLDAMNRLCKRNEARKGERYPPAFGRKISKIRKEYWRNKKDRKQSAEHIAKKNFLLNELVPPGT